MHCADRPLSARTALTVHETRARKSNCGPEPRRYHIIINVTNPCLGSHYRRGMREQAYLESFYFFAEVFRESPRNTC